MTIVPGYGNRSAKIMLVGEAPAVTEVRVGKPFQGRAGQELDKMLEAAGIRREDCYITNAMLEPVSGDKRAWFFEGKSNQPTPRFFESLKVLYADIAEIRPNIVVALGNYALWAMTMQEQILKRRGSLYWSPIANVKVIPVIHPAAILRGRPDEGAKSQGGMYKMRTVCIWDLQRAKEQSAFPDLRLRERRLIVDPPPGPETEAIVQRLLSAPKMVVDIETYGGLKLACIGFSDGSDWAVTWSYRPGQEDRLQLFKGLLESDIPKVGQNLMYDATMLDQIGIHTKNIWWDTMIAQHTNIPDLPKGLDFMTSIYTDIPYYKDEGKTWKEGADGPNTMQFFLYNAKDVVATAEIQEAQARELEEKHLTQAFRNSMAVFEPLRWATYRGMRCDHKQLLEFINGANERMAQAQKELNELAGWEVNTASHLQVKKLLYVERNLSARKDQSSDAPTILDIAARTGDPAPYLVIRVREEAKLISNYYNTGILSPDGRVRFGFKIGGTFGARLSSHAPLWGPGLNGQNIPGPARRMLVPDDGYTLLEFDQVQAEAVLVAYLANDPVHIDSFRTGKDVHRVTACLLSGADPADWKKIPKDAPLRQIAKKCNHSFNYNVGYIQFMRIVNQEYDPTDENSVKLTQAQAKELRDRYLATRPALPAYWDSIRAELKLNRTLRTPLGREFQFLDQWSDELLKRAYSYKPQCTVGEITNIGMAQVEGIYEAEHLPNSREMSDELRRMGLQFLLQVHDSTAWQIPNEAVDEAAPLMFKLLEVPLSVNGYQVVVPIEGKKGTTWYKGDMEDLGQSRQSSEVGFE